MDLRPLELGELVDRSAAVWRTHWKSLFRLYLGFQLLQYAVLKGFGLVARKYFPVLLGGKLTNDALKGDLGELTAQFAIAAPMLVLVVAFLGMMTHALAVAGAAYVIPFLYGQTTTVREALKRLGDRLGATIGLLALSFGWLLGWGVLSMLPGAGLLGLAIAVESQAVKAIALVLAGLWLAAASVVVMLGYVIRFATADQVIAMEDVGALGVYRRSRELSSGRVGDGLLGIVKLRLTLVITVVSVILIVLTLMGSLPAAIIEGYYGKVFDPVNANPDLVPQLLLVPAELFQLIVGSLVAPLYAVAIGWFYFDMRMRREGLDLELKLGQKP